jgi:hypothetical protein
MARARLAFLVACSLSLLVALPARAETKRSPNMHVVANMGFEDGTDLDFRGDLAFVGSESFGQDAGLRIFDISDPEHPALLSWLPCPGSQNDVGVWRDTVVLGMHESGNQPGCTGSGHGGLRIVDATDPGDPHEVSFVDIETGGTHTVTIVGDTGYVYANPGGIGTSPAEMATTIVDIRDPAHPNVAGTFTPPGSTGCHDVNVVGDRAYCAGSQATQIWDVSDPLHPSVISAIVNPLIFFHHTALPTPDGTTLVIADEAFGAHVCEPTGHSPTGAYWFYDISNEAAPVLKGYISQTQITSVETIFSDWCTSHNFNFVPETHLMVSAAYIGGTTVMDISNPTVPTIVGWIIPDRAWTWSSYYHDGYIYTGDMRRGFDVLSMDELLPGVARPRAHVRGRQVHGRTPRALARTGSGGVDAGWVLVACALAVALWVRRERWT